ncbi:glycosyl transferase family 1 [Bacillus hominis]|uniref:glycosyl transferase family 1 n=1 Tax=Bacillus hominis TaxID=2817478 RepID=UPI001BB41788|nr:glycosyl transferase family 1 [Bacillus hominis]
MDKILYLAFIREDSESLGFVKKVYSQCKAFNELSNESYLYISRKDSAELYRFSASGMESIYSFSYSRKARFKETNFLMRKLKNLMRFREFLKGFKEAIKIIEPSKVYIRRISFVTNSLIELISDLNNRGIKVFYEYPDFPDIPWVKLKKKGISNLIKYRFEKNRINKLKKHLYRLVAISVDESIKDKDVEIIYIRNGIDINEIKVSERERETKKIHEINLVGVANLGFWHAYDRVLKGMQEYYRSSIPQSIVVNFHIVGEGKEKRNLEGIVADYKLHDYVTFHGSKNGQELDRIFDKSDIGIGILGNHRKELYGDSSLKNREYCARGIPFVIAATDLDFPDEINFVHHINADDSSVNIDELINFYKQLGSEDIKSVMREYSERNLQWKEKMKVILSE